MFSGWVIRGYLEVSVDHSVFVAVLHSVDDRGNNTEDLLFAQLFVLLFLLKKSVPQAASSHELEDHVQILVVFLQIVELDDVGVVDFFHDLDLRDDRLDLRLPQVLPVLIELPT